jgi:hypothetical protein
VSTCSTSNPLFLLQSVLLVSHTSFPFRSSGDGRVVTCCLLERLEIERDKEEERSAESFARRLLISHDGLDIDPPGMFLFDEAPGTVDNIGPFLRVKQWRSSLDVWFEEDAVAQHALDVVNSKIASCKGRRGNHIRKYLSQGDESGYSLISPR